MFKNAPPSVVGCRSIRNGMTAGLESESLVRRDSAVPDARCRRLVGHRRSPAVWLRCLCLFVHNRFHKFYSFIHYSPAASAAGLQRGFIIVCRVCSKRATLPPARQTVLSLSLLCAPSSSPRFNTTTLSRWFSASCNSRSPHDRWHWWQNRAHGH